MQYILLFNEPPSERAKGHQPESAQAYWGGWSAYMAAMRQAGVIVNGDGLQGPETATTVRIRDGKRTVQDGPFADTKEALGGYVVLEVADLDGALAWAARAPCVHVGSVEVRPVLMMPPSDG